MNAKHVCTLLALSLAFAGNLALAHGGHDHNGHAEQPPAARGRALLAFLGDDFQERSGDVGQGFSLPMLAAVAVAAASCAPGAYQSPNKSRASPAGRCGDRG